MPKSQNNDNRTEEMNIKAIDRIAEPLSRNREEYKEQEELVRAIEELEEPLNIVMRLLYIDGLS